MALGRFFPVIGCGYSSSEIQSLCSAPKMFPPFLYRVNTMQPPIGQKHETDPHRKIGSRSIGAVGKLSLSLPASLSFSLAQCGQQFLLFQTCAYGNKADWCHNRAVNNFSGRNLEGKYKTKEGNGYLPSPSVNRNKKMCILCESMETIFCCGCFCWNGRYAVGFKE